MFFWTPKLEEYHADGSPIHRLALESQPTRWGKVRVAVDPWLRLAGPLLLAIAFLLQLAALIVSLQP